jgi:hypothetical protein
MKTSKGSILQWRAKTHLLDGQVAQSVIGEYRCGEYPHTCGVSATLAEYRPVDGRRSSREASLSWRASRSIGSFADTDGN